MNTPQFMKQSLGFLHESFRTAGDGLTPEQLHHSPEGESHSIAWIQWHAARIEDLLVQQVFQGQPQIWNAEWARRTGLPADGFGTGQSTPDAKAVRIADSAAFAEYAQQVAKRTDALLDSLDDAALERHVTVGQRDETIGESITLHLVTHLNGHRGEVNLLRGEMGFQPVLVNRGG